MHSKIYALIITFLVSISFCCSAYATAIEGDGLNEIVNEVNTEGSEVLNTEGSEGSSEVGSDVSSSGSETLIVDVSEQSINAIADAVSASGTVVNKEGVQYNVPSEMLEFWEDYDYHIYNSSGWKFTNNVQIQSSTGYLQIKGGLYLSIYGGSVVDLATYQSGKYADSWYSLTNKNVYFSDTDIYYDDGSLYYSSDTATEKPVEHEYSIELSNGKILTLKTNVENLLDDYHVVVHRFSDRYILNISSSGYYVNSSHSLFAYDDDDNTTGDFNYDGVDGTISFDSLSDLDGTQTYTVTEVYYSNRHIFYADGEIFYISPIAPPAVISFVSGKDDLVYDSLPYDNSFMLPRPQYEDCVFAGWYYDAEFTKRYSASDKIYKDTTLYGKWREAPQWNFISTNIFDSLIEFFSCEPIFYIFSLICFVMIIACIRVIITSRL